MVKLINTRLAVRVALLVNCFLLVMVAVGVGYVYLRQSGALYTQLRERGRLLSMVGAKSLSTVMEESIDNGVFDVDSLFDTEYEVIDGFSPSKYHTRYDAYMDKAILKLQDEFLEDPSVLYAVAVDANGYMPTHNTRYQQPITGDERKDLLGNRTKRILADAITTKASQNRDKGFVQAVKNENSKTVLDISSPIYVKGRHWGFFKVGMATASAQAKAMHLLRSLAMGGAIFLLFSATVIFLIVNRALRPLVDFSKRASDLADGDVDRKIEFKRKDEIGKVADALERLRISLQAAIERLMRR